MKLKQQLIGVQAKIELEDAKKSENDKRVIRAEALDKMQDLESDYNKKVAKQREEGRKKLAKAAADAAKAELAVQQSIQDLRVALIKDDHLRELAELDLQTERKIEALKGSEGQIAEQTSLLLLAKQDKIAELTAKWDEDAAKKKEEDAQKQADVNAAADEEYAAYLENKVANGLLTEQAYQDALYEIKRQALENQLKLLADAGKGETAEAKRIRTSLLQGETEHVNGQKKLDQDQQKFKKTMATEGRSLLNDTLSFLVDNLDKQSTAHLMFKNALKTLQIAEIGINLEAQLAAIAKNVSTDPLSSNVLTAGIPIANGAVQTALAIGRAAVGVVKIAAFADGGRTDQLVNQVPMGSLAALLSGASGGSIAPNGSFVNGGRMDKATVGLIGEAGAELVVPNWLFSDPKQANLMGYLEAQIASKGNAFVDGGRTVDRATMGPVATPGGEGDTMLELMQEFVKGQREFRDEISTWQREFEVRQDLFKLGEDLETVKRTKSGGGLK